MAKEKMKEQSDRSDDEIIEIQTKTEDTVLMGYDQFLDRFRAGMNKYTRAYFQGEYRGILKSKEDWESVLKDKV